MADVTAETGFNTNEQIKEIADKLHLQIQSIYDSEAASSPSSSVVKSPRKNSKENALDGTTSQSKPITSTTDDLENWDVQASKQTIKRLLNALQTEQRADCVEKLSAWFANKAKRATQDSNELTAMEAERSTNEDITRSATKKVEKELENKEMEAVRSLNAFYRMLSDVGKKGRKAAAQKRTLAKRHFEAASEYRPEEWRAVEITQGISDMRELLLKQEQEFRKSKEDDTIHEKKVADLLEVLTKQQDDVDGLTKCVEENERRVKTLKLALEWTAGGSLAHDEPDEAVIETIQEMKKAVRETKIAELTAHRKSLAEKMVTDGETTDEIERESGEIRKMVEDVERQIRECEEESAENDSKEMPKALNLDDLSEEKIHQVKERLHKEAMRMANEEKDLEEQCEKVEGLARRAQTAVRMMEAQKQEFIECVAEAKKNLLGEQAPTSENDAGFPGMSETKEFDPELSIEAEMEKEKTRQKEEEELQRMREEEKALKAEIEEMERSIAQTKLAARNAHDQQDEVRTEIEAAQQDLDVEEAKLENDTPEVTSEYLGLLANTNQELLSQIEEVRSLMRERESPFSPRGKTKRGRVTSDRPESPTAADTYAQDDEVEAKSPSKSPSKDSVNSGPKNSTAKNLDTPDADAPPSGKQTPEKESKEGERENKATKSKPEGKVKGKADTKSNATGKKGASGTPVSDTPEPDAPTPTGRSQRRNRTASSATDGQESTASNELGQKPEEKENEDEEEEMEQMEPPPEEFKELLQVHENNIELLKEIEVIEARILYIRSNPSSQIDLDSFKDSIEKPESDSQEYSELIKTMRQKQKELKEIRERYNVESQRKRLSKQVTGKIRSNRRESKATDGTPTSHIESTTSS
eukprot:gnl/MRDRNA2_/MRDRNA2_28815_c0_seq1.p1 gnl/MRDRNA2_/MRDRNA2_28815_c0~~gnl/MRDRNA2_/MRDRNA2_28815_c0_seq1.p1  ORF type:complete len:871 (+),score=263.32 gnl/MRDRNA2_/MRDRNA2_28815_c0_seq1:58-2670(+)